MGKERFLGAKAQGLVQISAVPTDGDKIVIANKTYEFDTPDGVTAGAVAVSIASGTAAGVAAALITAINANKPTPGITASADPLDNTKVRLTADARGEAANMAVTATFTSGSNTAHALIGGEAGGTQTQARGQYVVLQDDIDTVKSVEVDSSLTSPRFCMFEVRHTAGAQLAYDGAFTISGSKLRWDMAGSADMIAGDIITWMAWE